jgi:type I restriction enzyme M protein
MFELSLIYETLLKNMGGSSDAGEFYTPRAVIKAMVESVDLEVGQTVYDGAVGSGGFLIEAYNHMSRADLSTTEQQTLKRDTFFGNEKTPLGYVMGVMNMILHGIDSPNVFKQNTLTQNIRDIQEKDRHDVILANPPFGGKEKSQVQQNFPIQSKATEILFMQHFMKMLKLDGKAAIVVPEGIMFNSENAFKQVKQELLENFNVHTILSLPAGVFLPYSNVKTNIIYFDRKGATSDIWYYELVPPYKLTKNKPIQFDHFKEFLELYESKKESDNSWLVKVEDIKDYDISAKNPNAEQDEELLPPKEILQAIRTNDKELGELINNIESLLNE